MPILQKLPVQGFRNPLPEQEDTPLPPSDYHLKTPPEEYDVNFVYSVRPQLVSNSLVITPLIVGHLSFDLLNTTIDLPMK